jgi:hypothetical protein
MTLLNRFLDSLCSLGMTALDSCFPGPASRYDAGTGRRNDKLILDLQQKAKGATVKGKRVDKEDTLRRVAFSI